MCSFPNHVQLTEHVTGGDLKNDQWEQDAPELYLSRQRLLSYFCFSIFNKLARISSQHFYFILFYISSLWGVVCRTLR